MDSNKYDIRNWQEAYDYLKSFNDLIMAEEVLDYNKEKEKCDEIEAKCCYAENKLLMKIRELITEVDRCF